MENSECLAPGWIEALDDARPWRPPPGPYLIVVPHPDDEAVMFGGHLAHVAGRGGMVHVIAVTDGGAAYPGRIGDGELAAVRRAEQDQALGALGLVGTTTTRLGLPDGSVAAHEDVVGLAVDACIQRHDIAVVMAPWVRDHHADHEACGRGALSGITRSRREVTLVSGLFWSLLRDDADDSSGLRFLALTPDELDRKRNAIDCHRSQVSGEVVCEPVLGEVELSIARWHREHVLVRQAGAAS